MTTATKTSQVLREFTLRSSSRSSGVVIFSRELFLKISRPNIAEIFNDP
jgi:hypothetical protein